MPSTLPVNASAQQYIRVKGVTTHNLKGFDLDIPCRKFIVVTGLSGAGKSSLAFSTLYTEAHRRYSKSLNAYVQQFIGIPERASVKSIQGIMPTIALQQKSRTNNPRARVSTSADLYSYLKILYARIGTTYSPISGQAVQKETPEDVVNYLSKGKKGSKAFILAPLSHPTRTFQEILTIELSKGYTRVFFQGKPLLIEDLLKQNDFSNLQEEVYLVVDTLVVDPEDGTQKGRIAESAQMAFFEGKGHCVVVLPDTPDRSFSNLFECDGLTFEEPSLDLFNFNNPHGACKECKGSGKALNIDPHKVIPNPHLSIIRGAVYPWQSVTMKRWEEQVIDNAIAADFPIYKPYNELTDAQKKMLWEGNEHFKGINDFFKFLASKSYKIQYRILQARYRTYSACTACASTGLRPEAAYVKIANKSLIDILHMTIDELHPFFTTLKLPPHHQKISKLLLKEIVNKLYYLQQVNLGYLTPNRLTNTLSGGEYQRLRLARACGSPLVDSLYILDEFTTGLHPRDVQNSIKALLALLNSGNTLIAVEHEEAVMRLADQIIEIGPEAGSNGGELVFQGSYDALLTRAKNSYTAEYLSGRAYIPLPSERKKWRSSLTLTGVASHNLKNITCTIPLKILTVVTGVSGSGKSTLVEKVLYPALCNALRIRAVEQGTFSTFEGEIGELKNVVYIGQDPLGKSTRSNPATYLKAYTHIRNLFAAQPLAQERLYKAGYFSFNIPGGRCETCFGEGTIKVDMQFMSDIFVTCEECNGQRFTKDALDVTFKGKNITETLEMTIDNAMTHFAEHAAILDRLRPLQDVGLGYLTLGQASSTFSGGEAQRVKISSYLIAQEKEPPTLFIFDEPTTGLHLHDINQLMVALKRLIAYGHTVVVIEHNTEVIKLADWVIDLGPEGGKKGGEIRFAGTPEDMIKLSDNHTARYLKEKMVTTRRNAS